MSAKPAPDNAEGLSRWVEVVEVEARKVQAALLRHGIHPYDAVVSAPYNPALHDRWSTTTAVPGNYTSYALESQSGYLMTIADPGKPSVELEDCVSQRPGHPDHLLAERGFCEAHGYQRLRMAGWIYAQSQPDTVPLYRCYNAKDQSHFASNMQDCEKLGAVEQLLGYALKQ